MSAQPTPGAGKLRAASMFGGHPRVMENQPVTGDAFGELLVECWAGGGEPGVVYEVIERDDGFISVGEVSRYFAPPERWGPLERRACQRARGRVLDVGCGAGRHAVALGAQGLEVVGLDPSPGAVTVSSSRGVQTRRGVVTDVGDGWGTFDSIVMLGNNLGLLGSAEEAPAVLASLARVARPGTRLYGGSVNPYETQTPEHVAYHEENRRAGRLPGQLRIRVRHKLLATDWFNYLFVSPQELAALLAGTPWTLTEVTTDGPNYLAELSLTSASSR